VVAFPGHVVVAAAVDPAWLAANTKDGDFGTPMSPAFLTALEQRLAVSAGNLDAMLMGSPLPGPPPLDLRPLDLREHDAAVPEPISAALDACTFTASGETQVLGPDHSSPPRGPVPGWTSRYPGKSLPPVSGRAGSALSGPGGSAPAASVPADSAPAVSGPADSAPAVSGPGGPAPSVSGPAGSAPAVSQPAGSAPAVSGPAGSASAVSGPAGSASAVSGPGGSASAVSGPAGSASAVSGPAGSAPAVSEPGGSAPTVSGPGGFALRRRGRGMESPGELRSEGSEQRDAAAVMAVTGGRVPAGAGVHPRVERALRYRTDVRVWTSEHGVLILGRGLAGRWETAIEVSAGSRNKGYGRALATAARHLVPDGRPVWGQIAPGNASSLRAFLAAGYVPVGSEVILTPFPPEAPIRHP
jgi:hypothetical protein